MLRLHQLPETSHVVCCQVSAVALALLLLFRSYGSLCHLLGGLRVACGLRLGFSRFCLLPSWLLGGLFAAVPLHFLVVAVVVLLLLVRFGCRGCGGL